MELVKGNKATLIQDITELMLVLVPEINQIVEKHNLAEYSGITMEECILWIIAEELWQAYGLHRLHHDKWKEPYRSVRGYLSNVMNKQYKYGLEGFITSHVKALVMYDPDREIDLALLGRDLYIRFYGQVYNGTYDITPWKT